MRCWFGSILTPVLLKHLKYFFVKPIAGARANAADDVEGGLVDLAALKSNQEERAEKFRVIRKGSRNAVRSKAGAW